MDLRTAYMRKWSGEKRVATNEVARMAAEVKLMLQTTSLVSPAAHRAADSTRKVEVKRTRMDALANCPHTTQWVDNLRRDGRVEERETDHEMQRQVRWRLASEGRDLMVGCLVDRKPTAC